MKVILGAGGTWHPDWLSTDVPELDLTQPLTFERFFGQSKAEAFLAEHVWEHLAPDFWVSAAYLCRKYLAPGGRLRIAVPDGFHPNKDYIDWVRPGGVGPGALEHKALFDHHTLRAVLVQAGFGRIVALEWHDHEGKLFRSPWKPEDGFVKRSFEHDKDESSGRPKPYTSLIMDAFTY